MGNFRFFDVVVAGAGPGGAMAAKRCAELGLKTLLVAKKILPRDKVSTGMIMGDWAVHIIRDEFGVIPGALRESLDTKTSAAPLYLQKIATIVKTIERLHKVQGGLKSSTDGGCDHVAATLLNAYRETLTVQSGV